MNRRSFAAVSMFVTIAFASLAGCSGAPPEESAASTDQAIYIPPKCTAPFTTPEFTCWTNANGQRQCGSVCASVVQPAQQAPSPTDQPAHPIAQPIDLEGQGCTYGLVVSDGVAKNGSLWACPSSSYAFVSSLTTFGGLPVCPPQDGGTYPQTCAHVFTETTVPPNPYVGNPDSGWFLFVDITDGSGGSCQGGCAMPWYPYL